MLFEDTIDNTDFNRSSVYGHYELQGARTDITANLGIKRVDQGNDSINGPLAKLMISRRLSSATNLTFTVGRDITDASAGFSSQQAGAIGTIGTSPAAQALTNYIVTYASAQWQYTHNRTSLSLSGNWEKDAYDGQPFPGPVAGVRRRCAWIAGTHRIADRSASGQRISHHLHQHGFRRDRRVDRRLAHLPRRSRIGNSAAATRPFVTGRVGDWQRQRLW